jgi:hypothetical protein
MNALDSSRRCDEARSPWWPTSLKEVHAPPPREYERFLHIAIGSALEVAYLARLSGRLGFGAPASVGELADRYEGLVRALQKQVSALRSFVDQAPR